MPLAGLIPYTERHFARIDRLAQQSFLADYTWQGMRHGFDPIDIDAISADHPLGDTDADHDQSAPRAILDGQANGDQSGSEGEAENAEEEEGSDEFYVDGNVQFTAVVASETDEAAGESDEGEQKRKEEESDDEESAGDDSGDGEDNKSRGVKRALASKTPAAKKTGRPTPALVCCQG